MHGAFTRMLLHQLLDEAEGDRAEAARRVGVGRSTMYRWIEAGPLHPPIESLRPRSGPRPGSGTKLDPFNPITHKRPHHLPRLTGIRPLSVCLAAAYTAR